MKTRQRMLSAMVLSLACAMLVADPAAGEGWSLPWSKSQKSSRRTTAKKPSMWSRTTTASKNVASKSWDYMTLKPVRDKLSQSKSGIVTNPTVAKSNQKSGSGMFSWMKGEEKRQGVKSVAARPKSNDKQWWDPRDWFRGEDKKDTQPQTVADFMSQPRPGEVKWQ